MSPVWDPECIVTADLALQLIADQFPQLPRHSIEVLGIGFDNTAYLINGELVFRFPRRQIAVPLLERESSALPRIAERVPLSVPVPEWIGKPCALYRWPFAGYKMVPGRTACGAGMSDAERAGAAPVLGRFLRELHDIDLKEAECWGICGDVMGKIDTAKRVPQLIENLNEIGNRVAESEQMLLRRVVERAHELTPDAQHVLLHGDMYARHVLVNETSDVVAVIDWGDLHIGDPAVDLSVAHHFLPPSAYAAFRDAYGPISDASWKLAQFRALFVATVLVVYGTDKGDRDIAEEGLRVLSYIADAESRP